MPRIARIVVPGVAHHITQRGNRRMDVFFSDGDRAAYLDLLQELSAQHGLHILGYCLMSNHVHLIALRIPGTHDLIIDEPAWTRRIERFTLVPWAQSHPNAR